MREIVISGEFQVKLMKFLSGNHKYAMYLAVLPKYRADCIELTLEQMSGNLDIFISSEHLDKTVKTGIPSEFYKEVSIIRLLGGRLFIQWGGIRESLKASTTIVDLNPRSITAWLILFTRRILNRRSLVWGHIHPRAGDQSNTAFLRKWMRRLADGTVCYTYSDADKAQMDEPGSKVWTAPNSLYKKSGIHPGVVSTASERQCAIYVGRFEEPKKVLLLLEGFHRAVNSNPEIRLLLVGGGSSETSLREYVDRHGLADKVTFAGWVDDIDELRRLYSLSFCAVSPGFAGLGLTQSLGFGVPMVVAKDEPHAPEIELAALGGVDFFESNSPESLADMISERWERKLEVPYLSFSEYVRNHYSAEAMSDGLISAIKSTANSGADK